MKDLKAQAYWLKRFNAHMRPLSLALSEARASKDRGKIEHVQAEIRQLKERYKGKV